MKKIIVTCLIFLFTYTNLNSQDIPQISSEGFNISVNAIEGGTEKLNYDKYLKWINKNYNNANYVIGSKIENELLRFTGITSSIGKSMGYTYDLKYTIRIDFKDSRFRFTTENISLGYNGIYNPIRYSDYYKKNGNIRKSYSELLKSIESEIQSILISSFNYLSNKKQKDEW